MLATMDTVAAPALQPTLLDGGEVRLGDPSVLARTWLGQGAWVDHAPAWLAGADACYDRVLAAGDWRVGTMEMYGERVTQPRMTSWWTVGDLPDGLAVLDDLAALLSDRYGVAFTSIGCNLYRDGRDSVAWHGDRIARDRPTATIAILSLGHRRPFRLRPRGGGGSVPFALGRGDLLVMGGTCQRTWQHTVPKVASAGPRISVTFRHEYGTT